MKKLTLSVLILLAPLACRAADDMTSLGLKPGLWESTVTIQSGMGAIPPEALAKLTPEQRARIEAQLNAPHSSQSCYTSESFKKFNLADSPNSSCKHTVTSSASGALDFHIECDNGKTKSVGDGHVQATSPESMKGETTMNTTVGAGRTMSSKIVFNSKWIGSDCGSVKPR